MNVILSDLTFTSEARRRWRVSMACGDYIGAYDEGDRLTMLAIERVCEDWPELAAEISALRVALVSEEFRK